MEHHEQHPPKIERGSKPASGHLEGQAGRCLLYGKDTAGAHSLTYATMSKGTEAPLHVHSREDETFYALSGELDARVGDEHHELTAGDAVFLPRGLKHRLMCKSDRAEVIMLIHPPGLEHFFEEIDRAASEGPSDKAEMASIAEKYGVTILPE